MRRWLLLACTLAAACAPTNSAPCETDADCEAGVCRLGGCGPECLDVLDCDGGEACVEGACVPAPQCAASSDCAPGFACEGGQCRCTGDAACARNEACVDGACLVRPPCTSNVDCAALGLRCDLAQGLCVPPCASAADCAPGIDPTLAALLYACTDGTCQQRCFNGAGCGAGLTCRGGVCTGACRARSDCGATEYCTSATGGSCEPYLPCASESECPVGSVCEAFAPAECPPDVGCAQAICRPLPGCVLDPDCQGLAFCEERHCRPSTACDPEPCPGGRVCVAHLCVPGGCRGTADCAPGETCSEGGCTAPAAATDVVQLQLLPRRIVLEAGEALALTVHGVRANGQVVPVAGLTWSVLDAAGEPSGAASVDDAGRLQAVAPGTVRVRASLPQSAAPPAELTLHVIAPAAADRRKVVVTDAVSMAPLAGVSVTLCDAPAIDAPCPAPVEATTDADGVADFASAGTTATVTAVSAELRADGLPRYDRVTILSAGARTLLVPLTENAAGVAAGMTGTIDFGQAQGLGGGASLGLVALSAGAPWELAPRTLLGDTYSQRLPAFGGSVPLPAGAVVSADLGFGAPFVLKGTADVVSSPGARSAVAFGGGFELASLATLSPVTIASRVAAMDYAVDASLTAFQRPLVPDTTDRDGDGRCESPTTCPAGSELIADFGAFPSRLFTPSREQRRRTEVVLPPLPAGFDAALVTALEVSPWRGLTPFGLAPAQPDPSDTTGLALLPLVLRSGAPYGGAEYGSPAVGAVAYAEATPDVATSVRLSRQGVLPTRAVLAAFLPVAGGTCSARTFSPEQPAWNTAASAGATLARLTFTGASSRHVVYFGVEGAQTSVYVPAGGAGAGADPLDGEVSLEVALLAAGETPADGVFGLSGENLGRPAEWVDAAAVTRP